MTLFKCLLRAVGLLALFCAVVTATGQTSEGGTPFTFENNKVAWDPGSVELPPFDIEAMLAEDAVNNRFKDRPFRFGKNIALGADLAVLGNWHELPSGDRVCLFEIASPGAYSLNVTFDDFEIPEGGRLFLYSPDHNHVLGAFTAANNQRERGFGTYPIPGDRIVLEYYEPLSARGAAKLHIENVTHAYLDLNDVARGIGDSGACNNNVVCSLADDWRDEIDAVAMIVVNGNGICSGALVNNTANDGHPYFLTANHCLGGNVSNWVYRFNWQSTTCNTNNVGSFDTVSGSTLLASGGAADYALFRINNGAPVPEAYNPFYAGWDATGAVPQSNVGIHHPSGDLKKISFDTDPAGTANFGGAVCWRVFNWESGTTEPGSSGSPLFDQNKRITGQLYGGQATCSNNVNDYYGKFDVTYPNICQWIAPGCNTLILDGYRPNAQNFENDAQLLSIVEPQGSYCSGSVTPSITIRNAGTNAITSLTVNYDFGGAPLSTTFTGNLPAGATSTLPLDPIAPGAGTFTFSVTLTNPNGVADENPGNNSGSSVFTMVPDGQTITFSLTTDNYPAETTWEIRDDSNNVVASDGPYSQAQTTFDYAFCLPAGCYTLTVFDSFGDGLQFQGVVGNYTLTGEDGTVLAQMVAGGNFGSQAVHNFCLSSTPVPGCTNATACNFDPVATTDDGTCEFVSCAGCTDASACNYAPSASIDDGSCEFNSCAGCTDPLADNFNDAATIDDGSCTYTCIEATITVSTDCWGEEVSWVLTGPGGVVVESVATNTLASSFTYTWTVCLPEGCYGFTINDTFGDGMFGSQYQGCSIDGNYSIVDENGAVLVQMTNPDYGFGTTENFCIEPGVEPPTCIGDLNNDGAIDVMDILILLGDFGCAGSCIGDLNANGQTDAGDFNIMLGVFGSFCD